MRLAILWIVSVVAIAQTPAAFDVASVKPQPFTGKGGEYVGIFVRGNTLDAQHVSLNSLVMFAYNLRGVQLSGGPSWATSGVLIYSDLYQVTAKAAGDPPPPTDTFRRMLQTVLAERFQLKVHHIQKDLPTYNLVIGKGGPKLKESPAEAKFNFAVSGRGNFGIRIVATHMTVQELLDHQLSGYAARPIFDKTGLTASYDFTLEFETENVPAGQDDSNPAFSSLVTAVQEQLGLKLEPSTAPFDTVVIDHAEKPSEN